MVSLEFRVGLPLFTRHRQDPVIDEKLASVRAQEASVMRKSACTRRRCGRRSLSGASVGSAEALRDRAPPAANDRSRAAVASYGAGRGDLRTAIDALSDEIDIQLEYVELEGSVARAWTFLHLLHDSGTSP